MNAVYCVFLRAEGESQSYGFMRCTRGTDVEQWREAGCKSLCWTDADHLLTSSAEGLRESPLLNDLHSVAPCRGSWHHNYIMRASPLPSARATEWSERGSVSTLAQEHHHWVELINWFADLSGHCLFKIGYRPAWWMRCSSFDDSV